MSGALFTPKRFGPLVVPNRFMRSATWEGLGDAVGNPTPKLFTTIEDLAKGGVGLIVSGAMMVTPKSQCVPSGNLMCLGENARAWKPIVDAVHKHGSTMIFQLMHCSRFANPQLNGGFKPKPVSALDKDEEQLTDADIDEIIQQFLDSAYLSAKAGADGVQIHGAHLATFAEFLSPHYNRRTDKWGGSPENRVRVIKELTEQIRKRHPNLMLSIKLNGTDYLDDGVTPALASQHVHLLSRHFDLFEVSCGMSIRDFTQSTVDDSVLVRGVNRSDRSALIEKAHALCDPRPFKELYNLDTVKLIRQNNPSVGLAIVGGCRTRDSMQNIIESGYADMVSMSRPFIRDPNLVNRFKTNELSSATCTSCGTCLISPEKGVFCHKP